MSSTSALFRPIRVGDVTLSHRVVLAPLTRYRNDAAHVPTNLMVEYYTQRASVPGTLLITEAAFISPQASGLPHAPGIWNDEQIAAWKTVVDAVHAKGSYIYMQIWALGRAARPAILHKEFPDFPYVAPSPIGIRKHSDNVPRELTHDEIKEYVRWFAQAATNAVKGAGFDGVEVHGANGYLIDQFLQDVSNQRIDAYGGSIENRARFALEVMDAVVNAIGQTKTSIRLTPWSTFQDMRMDDPIPQFIYLVDQIKQRYPNLAYIHVVAPAAFQTRGPDNPEESDFIYRLWAPRPVITTGGYDRDSGLKTAEETGQLIGYGQLFISNPDLPFRLRENIPLSEPDAATYYALEAVEGYTTYPFSQAFLEKQRT